MPKKSPITSLTETFRQWIEHTEANKSHIDTTLSIERKFKDIFVTLKEESHSLEELKEQLEIMVNHLSFQVDLTKFDEQEFFAFMKNWISQEPPQNLPYLILLSQLPEFLIKKMTQLQERQTELVITFLEWSDDRNNPQKADALKKALEHMRLGSDMITDDPGEAIELLQFIFAAPVQNIVKQLNELERLDDSLILDFENLGQIWEEAIDLAQDETTQKELDYHRRPYSCFFDMLRKSTPLSLESRSLFEIIDDELSKFKKLRHSYVSSEARCPPFILDSINYAVQILNALTDFLNSRHNFDIKKGISEAQEKQTRFFFAYNQILHIPSEAGSLTEEHLKIHGDCLEVLEKAIVILDFSIDTMKAQIETHIPSLKETLQTVIQQLETQLTSKQKRTAKIMLHELTDLVKNLRTFSDITQLRTYIYAKILELTNNLSTSNKSRRNSLTRLFSSDTSSILAQDNTIRTFLSTLLNLLPNVLETEALDDISKQAKKFPSLNSQNSEELRFSLSISETLLDTLSYRSSYFAYDQDRNSSTESDTDTHDSTTNSAQSNQSIEALTGMLAATYFKPTQEEQEDKKEEPISHSPRDFSS